VDLPPSIGDTSPGAEAEARRRGWLGEHEPFDFARAFADPVYLRLTGGPQDNYKYCSIDYPGATCGQANEVVGDMFMNIPQATIDGYSGGAYDLNRPNAVPLGQEPMAVLQYDFSQLAPQTLENLGRWERRITTGFARYNGQDTYSNAKVISHSNLILFNCGTPNLQRIGDLCLGKMPGDAPSTTSAPGNDFVPITILVQGQVQYAEVQFGYAENGPPEQLFCTTRQEACNTSSPPGTPFNWDLIAAKPQVTMVNIDGEDWHKANLRYVVYDGVTLPYKVGQDN